jgi:hypothetical protein
LIGRLQWNIQGWDIMEYAMKLFVVANRLMKLLKKQKAPKSVAPELTSSDVNIEKWLDSLTTSGKKSEVSSRSSASDGAKKKK